MAWVGPMFKQTMWNLFRGLFCLFRGIGWLFRCLYCRLSKNNREDAYKGTVQRMSIWGRHKVDLVLQPSGADNFLLVHDEWVDPEYVLDDTVSLYYITKDEAVFVQCPPNVVVYSGHFSPFLRIAQFKHAEKVLVMPMHVFHKLGANIGEPKGRLMFISNTARCGSTLLTQIFEETGKSIAFSEPDCMNALSVIEGKVPQEEYDLIIQDSVRILCKPNKQVPECLCYVIKLTQPTMMYIPYLTEKFPGCKNVFMYRNGLPMCKSLDKCGYEMPLLDMLYSLGKNSVKMTKKIVQQMGLPPDNFNEKAASRLFFSSIVWASSIQMYRQQRAQGINVAGVRYEDLVADPVYAVTQIFAHVQMPSDLIEVAARQGMSRDSQRTSPLSRDRLNRHQCEEYTDEIRALCDGTSAKFNLAKLDEDCILEGTITRRPSGQPPSPPTETPVVLTVDETKPEAITLEETVPEDEVRAVSATGPQADTSLADASSPENDENDNSKNDQEDKREDTEQDEAVNATDGNSDDVDKAEDEVTDRDDKGVEEGSEKKADPETDLSAPRSVS